MRCKGLLNEKERDIESMVGPDEGALDKGEETAVGVAVDVGVLVGCGEETDAGVNDPVQKMRRRLSFSELLHRTYLSSGERRSMYSRVSVQGGEEGKCWIIQLATHKWLSNPRIKENLQP